MAQIGNTTVLPSMTLGTPLPQASGGTGVSTVLAATKTALNASGSAPVYGCRTWVNFDATRNSSGGSDTANTNRFINGSGNITSVLRNSIGDYTITFTIAMPDANYSIGSIAQHSLNTNTAFNAFVGIMPTVDPTTTTIRVRVIATVNIASSQVELGEVDPSRCCIQVFG